MFCLSKSKSNFARTHTSLVKFDPLFQFFFHQISFGTVDNWFIQVTCVMTGSRLTVFSSPLYSLVLFSTASEPQCGRRRRRSSHATALADKLLFHLLTSPPQAQTPGRQRRSFSLGPPRQRPHRPPHPHRYISKLANWRPRRCHHQSGVFSARRGSPKRNSTTEESASEFLRFAARDLFMRSEQSRAIRRGNLPSDWFTSVWNSLSYIHIPAIWLLRGAGIALCQRLGRCGVHVHVCI